MLRALKKQTMPNSSRKLILVPPGSVDSLCGELRGNSEIHHLLQSPFITAHNNAQAVPEAIQLDFSSASLALSHVLLGTLVLHMSLKMQLIKTAALHVDRRKDEMTVLVLHFLLHALPNFCSSASQDPKTLIQNPFTLVTAALIPPPTAALQLKYLPSLERQLPLITSAAQAPRLQRVNPTCPRLFFYPQGF